MVMFEIVVIYLVSFSSPTFSLLFLVTPAPTKCVRIVIVKRALSLLALYVHRHIIFIYSHHVLSCLALFISTQSCSNSNCFLFVIISFSAFASITTCMPLFNAHHTFIIVVLLFVIHHLHSSSPDMVRVRVAKFLSIPHFATHNNASSSFSHTQMMSSTHAISTSMHCALPLLLLSTPTHYSPSPDSSSVFSFLFSNTARKEGEGSRSCTHRVPASAFMPFLSSHHVQVARVGWKSVHLGRHE
mmetsp:Transcript_17823/g.44200  ORF Transcript_17823/g.44200 Transcript_17823/m.44200 type:complete len:243 (+) Transcript_17823:144-872(+)